MEKLILEYQETDNCTYWATNTHPVYAESKESFINELETLLLQYQIDVATHDKQLDSLRSKQLSAYNKMNQDNKMSEKFSSISKQIKELEESFSYETEVGGFKIDYRDFINDGEIQMPTVYTLDEYFSNVIDNVNKKQNIKTTGLKIK